MKFEKTVTVRTPDGKDHPSVAAAEAHMREKSVEILAECTLADLQAAISAKGTLEEHQKPQVAMTRAAIRDVYIAAWPRANAGKPRAPKKEAAK